MWQFYFYFLRNLHSGCVNFYASLPPAAPQSPIPQPRPSPTPPYLVPGHSWGSSRQPVHCRSFPHLLSILGVGRHEPPAFPHCHLGFAPKLYFFLLSALFSYKWSEVAQSCPTLWDPMDSSLPGSAVHGIFQARVLEWGAVAYCLVMS